MTHTFFRLAHFTVQSALAWALILFVLHTSHQHLSQDLVLCAIIGAIPFLFDTITH